MDENKKPGLTPEKLHRRQAFLQIYLPLIIASLILGFLITLIILSTATSPAITQNWAHIAMLIMVVPVILLSIVLLVVISLAVFGMSRLNHFLPGRLKRIREGAVNLNARSQKVISKAANPVIHTKVFFSSGKAVFRGVKEIFTRARRQ